MCDRGIQMLITTVGAFAAFSLMTIAVGTDYWLYSRGVCRTKSTSDNETSRKNEEVMTHSGLWRTCCLEGTYRFLSLALNDRLLMSWCVFEENRDSGGEEKQLRLFLKTCECPDNVSTEAGAVWIEGLGLVDCFWSKLNVMRFCNTLSSFCSWEIF